VSESNPTPEQILKARTRRNFLGLGLGGAVAVGGWTWLLNSAPDNGLPGPLRRVLGLNRRLTSGLLYSDGHLAPEYPLAEAKTIKPNGDLGLDDDLDPAAWKLELIRHGADSAAPLDLKMEDIYKLPKVEHVTEFKCIEGWSTIVHWGGARLSDFTARYAPGSERAQYVGLQTPDNQYFVGVDMASAQHPQTLLCYEMNGKPLEEVHGAPLRLIIPVKYGIKNLKRIGQIRYTDQRPPDYWAQEGYDYYAGL
jgi:DMSO/TMAO reductase YedYZ molybdopterin-dependent catalytic subunit